MHAAKHLMVVWRKIYYKYSAAMYSIIWSLTEDKRLAQKIFAAAFIDFKENNMYSKLSYVLCASLMRHTYKFTITSLYALGISPKKVDQFEKEKLIYLLCTQCGSLQEVATMQNITEELAKINLRKEFLELRMQNKAPEKN